MAATPQRRWDGESVTGPEPVRVVGADVFRGRWVGVVLAGGAFERALVAATVTELAAAVGTVAAFALDIPIGLPASDRPWPRPADDAARHVLGPRRSTVFRAPPRPVLDEPDYASANRRHRALTGQGLSRQSWALTAKILEVEAFVDDGGEVIEAHPEVSFATMNGGPLLAPKKSWDGQAARFRLLVAEGILIPAQLGGSAGAVPPDDLLDAAAAAWTARRFARGVARRLPDGKGAGAIWA